MNRRPSTDEGYDLLVRDLVPPPALGEHLRHRDFNGDETPFMVVTEPQAASDGWVKFKTEPIIRWGGFVDRP